MHEEDEDVAQVEDEAAADPSTIETDAEDETSLALAAVGIDSEQAALVDGADEAVAVQPLEEATEIVLAGDVAEIAVAVATDDSVASNDAAVATTDEASLADDAGVPPTDEASLADVAAAAATDEADVADVAAAATTDEVVASDDDNTDDIEPLADDAAAEVDERLLGILESVLFACGEPITLARLMEVVAGPTRAELRAGLAGLAARAERDRRGIRLVEVAGGWQFRTAPEHGEWVRRLFQQRPWRLTRATLETLAIIAYKQPITRAEVEAIRGVDVDSVLASLLARKLVKIVGRKEVIGRPLLYGTTRQFLEVFGLRDLAALPGLAEVASAMPESVAAGAAGGDENTWSGDERNDEGHPPAEAAGGLGDVLATVGGDADPERASDREREDGHDPGDPSASD